MLVAELIAGVEDGLYLETPSSWSLDDKRMNFHFSVEMCREIKHGQFTGRVFAMLDLASFSLPMRALYQEGLRNGYLPIWTPSLFAGFYAHAEGQTGMLHPLHLLLYGTLPLQVACVRFASRHRNPSTQRRRGFNTQTQSCNS